MHDFDKLTDSELIHILEKLNPEEDMNQINQIEDELQFRHFANSAIDNIYQHM